jgi:hypothetical protein
MALSLTYRGSLGRNLTAAEVDANFAAIAAAILDLQTNPPSAINIESIAVTPAGAMTITLSDTTVLGPFQVAVPGGIRWRGVWLPSTLYSVLDTFVVVGQGIYTVMVAHTSATTFDPTITVSSQVVYQQLFGADPSAEDVIYDIEFYYAGKLSDLTTGYLYQESLLRAITLPAASVATAYLEEAPSIAAQVLSIYQNDAVVGSITFAIGAHTGVVVINSDLSLALYDRLAVGLPATADATAAGLTVGFAAQRVI